MRGIDLMKHPFLPASQFCLALASAAVDPGFGDPDRERHRCRQVRFSSPKVPNSDRETP